MFPYAAKVFRDYLDANLPGVRVSGDVPATVPAQLVTIRQVPAGSTDKPRHLGWRRLILRCRHDDGEISTGLLAETVRHLMVESKFAGIGVRRADVIGEPGRFDDPDDSKPWFQLTVDALFKATH
ncbi:hypothetical protein [Mycobacterium sp. CnD-18-1]|uniref:hypothetical protein n=1 Tax=Mycobacterium sp. CnD-18-1 TaxID=2917744 RepID=UPI001EF20B03|nr:hypothetical protein [Mycobacterium sp. CnD-18-1]